ncbi:hypothetical protein AABB24_000396, partial [Solanum stoloniferum]
SDQMIGRPKLNPKWFSSFPKNSTPFSDLSFPRILIFPRRSPPPMPLSTSPIKVGHEPPENNNIRRSPTPFTPHHLTISPPSPGAAFPHARHSFVPRRTAIDHQKTTISGSPLLYVSPIIFF